MIDNPACCRCGKPAFKTSGLGNWYCKECHDGPVKIPQKKLPYKRSVLRVGRNEPCPCGSGKKFKHCHLEQLTAGVRAKVVEASKKNQEAK